MLEHNIFLHDHIHQEKCEMEILGNGKKILGISQITAAGGME